MCSKIVKKKFQQTDQGKVNEAFEMKEEQLPPAVNDLSTRAPLNQNDNTFKPAAPINTVMNNHNNNIDNKV